MSYNYKPSLSTLNSFWSIDAIFKTAYLYLGKCLQDFLLKIIQTFSEQNHQTYNDFYHLYHLIGYFISNSLALFGPVPLGVLNESIQTLLTETGTPCHSPTFSRNHLGGRFSPTELHPSGHSFLSTLRKSTTGFQHSSPNARPTSSAKSPQYSIITTLPFIPFPLPSIPPESPPKSTCKVLWSLLWFAKPLPLTAKVQSYFKIIFWGFFLPLF